MKLKRIITLLLATIFLMANTTNLAFASDTIQEDEQVFELVWFDDEGNIVQPRINADGSFFSFCL